MNTIKLALVLMLSSTLLFSAVIPTPGDMLRQSKPVEVPKLKKALPKFVPTEYKAPLVVKDGIKVFVKNFRFSGNTVFSSEELNALVKDYVNKELTISQMKVAVSIVTKYYRFKGYFVARAYLPGQSLKGAIVEIAIIEGHYGKFNIKNSSLVNTAIVQAYMDHLHTGDIASTYTLERQMLLLNDLSGIQVTNAEISAGEIVGSSDFKVSTEATPKYSGYLIADNYGSRYTGNNRLSANGYVNSLTGIGDTLSISALSTNTADLKNGRVGYERPFGYSGLNGGVSFSITDYRLSEELKPLESFGRIDTYNAHIAYPYIKTQNLMLEFDLSYNHINIKSSLLGDETRKNIDSTTLRVNTLQQTTLGQLPGSLYASTGLTVGNLSFGNDKAYTDDIINAHGKYSKVNLDLIHKQYLANKLTLRTMLKAQKSLDKNLDSTEDISIGGSNGVRAYKDSEASGDEGYGVSLDLIYALSNIQDFSHSISIFIDHAKVWVNTDSSVTTDKNTRELNDIGIGWSGGYRAFDFKVTYAHGFGGESTPTAESQTNTNLNKILMQGIYKF